MKKKLIAIVTSLAMVATMVPATAFAATGTTKAAAVPSVSLATDAEARADEGSVASAYPGTVNKNITEGVGSDGKVTLSGTVEYVPDYEAYWPGNPAYSEGARNPGNYIFLAINAPNLQPTVNSAGWVYIYGGDGDQTKIKVRAFDGTKDDTKVIATQVAKDTTAGETVTISQKDLGEVRYLTPDGLDAIQVADTDHDGEIRVDDFSAWEASYLTTTNVIAETTSIALSNDTITLGRETKAQYQERQDAEANNTAAATLEAFKKAVNAIGDISGFSEDSDKKVINAYKKYLDLDPKYQHNGEQDVSAPKDNNNYDYYAKMMNAIVTQWNARIAKLEKSMKAVDPVRMGAKDEKEIAAIKELLADIERFDNLEDDGTTSSNDELWAALGDAKINADPLFKLGTTVKTKAENAITNARTAHNNAVAVEPVVIAIAGLDDVDGWTFADVLAAIAKIESDYSDIFGNATKRARVGNYAEMIEKKEAAEEIQKQVKEVADLVEKIERHLTIKNGVPTLTKNEIKAYTDAYNEATVAYDKLDAGQKAAVDRIVSNKGVDTIGMAATNIANYKTGLDKEIAVEEAINTLPNGRDAKDTLTIAETLIAFDELSDAAVGTIGFLKYGFKANISDQLKTVLANVKKILLTEGLRDNNKVNKVAIDTAVAPVRALIEALPTTVTMADEDAVNAAYDAYVAITTAFNSGINTAATDDAEVTAAIKTALADDQKALEAAKEQIDKIVAANETKVRDFISKVARISGGGYGDDVALKAALERITDKDSVEGNYYNFTTAARAAYEALTEDQKTIVAKDKISNAKLAYEKLQVAEKNIEAAKKLDSVAALIKAVPDAATLKVTDDAAVAKVEAAQKAYEELTAGAQKQLLTNNYVTVEELQNYNKAVKKVNDYRNRTAAAKVINLIQNLPGLPSTKFTDRVEIEGAYKALVDAEAAYNALEKGAQGAVTNASILTKYRTDFDRLMKKYADNLYGQVKGLDANNLTDVDTKNIAELKAYIDGQYIDTKDIAGFDKAVYDKLIVGLDATVALENATVSEIADVTYNGKEHTPTDFTVTDKAGRTVAASDYDVKYSSNLNAGVAYVIISAKEGTNLGYTGVVTKSFNIDQATLDPAKATVSGLVKKTYTGKAVGQSLTVKQDGNNLARNKDYTQTYKNNKNVGEASVILTGTGNYKGTITKKFIVTPKKGAIKSLKAGKKQVTVKVAAQAGAKYRIVYQTVNKANNGKAKAVNTASTSKTIKSLKAGKTYKVKVRGYKVVDGKTYYGAYSAWKKAKVK